LHYSHSYEPPPIPAYGWDWNLFFVMLLIIGFIAALIWLINWQPPKPSMGGKKNPKDEVRKIFAELKDDAKIYGRLDMVSVLEKAQERILKAVD
jgi:hypothetical protein